MFVFHLLNVYVRPVSEITTKNNLERREGILNVGFGNLKTVVRLKYKLFLKEKLKLN